MFRLTAHNTGAAAPLGALYSEDRLRSIVRSGYRVVIDSTPAALKELNETSTEKYPLQLALGFRAIYPPTMFAIPRTEFQTDQQDAAFDEQANRLDSSIGRDHYFSNRARCGEDIPPDDGIEVYRQILDVGKWESVQVPSAGPLPPQAPLAPTEKVDEYGVPPEGSMLLPPTFRSAKLEAAIYGTLRDDRGKDVSEEKPQGFWAWLSEIFGFDNTDES